MVAASAAGMLTLKYAERNDSVILLAVGYALEGYAFVMYPYCMRFFSLRLIVVSWSAGSNLTAFVSGSILFGENGGILSLLGVLCNITGVILVAMSH